MEEKEEDVDVWRGDRGREGLKEMGGMMREGEEVRKWMRQSYWDRGEGGRKEGASDERN